MVDEDTDQIVDLENKALHSRPQRSIRGKIFLAFSLFFFLCLILNVWSIWVLARMEEKIHFLNIADRVMAEIQQARRYEKNYLLYGTNLADAKEHLSSAQSILDYNAEPVAKVLSEKHFLTMQEDVRQYHALLREIGEAGNEAEKKRIEMELREKGGRIISFGEEFVKKEKENVFRILKTAQRAPFVFLFVLVVLMVFIAAFLTRQLYVTLQRFMEYTKRIGEGDFTPIKPVRKYRDEFTELAEAFNRMIRELDHRHNILVQSHKLRAIGTLVAGVAHELNNPLNNIMLTAALLKEDYIDLSDEEKMEMIEDMIQEAERSQGIVRNLLDFARESEAHIKPLELDRIVQESVRLVANQVRLKKVKLTVEIPSGMPHIHGDEQMLKQVFVNLILNAVDALPQGGQIVVSDAKAEEKGFLAVEVRDNGPGIPEHVLPCIFDPFFTTKTKGKGVGLGLSVTRGIIRRLGGFIRVNSRVGEGTTFTILLPVTTRPSPLSAGKLV